MSIYTDLATEISKGSDYRFKGLLSQEEFVLICSLKNLMGESRTARIFPLKKVFKTPSLKTQTLYQLQVFKMIRNANCFLKLETHFYTSSYLVMVFEDYYEYSLDKVVTELDVAQYLVIIMKDLIDALVILRESKLIHTLICPQVVYVINGYVKLGGLQYIQGISCEQNYDDIPSKLMPYLSPEIYLKRKAIFPSQIFSFGMLFYELLFKRSPFPLMEHQWTFQHYKEFYEKVKLFDFKINEICIEPNVFEIVKECLKIDYPNRMTLRYLQEVSGDFLKSQGSILTLRKRAITKTKEGVIKRNFESSNSKKTASMNSIRRCKLKSPPEDPG
jgi:serine/threonine protein kinase